MFKNSHNMWLIKDSRLKTLNKENALVQTLIDSEKIKYKKFKRFKKRFEKRLLDHNHYRDVVPQYFQKETVRKVMRNGSKRVAFVFLAQNDGSSLSVAVIGLDQAGHFINSDIYESSVKSGVENQMSRTDQEEIPGFDSRRLFYESRMKGDGISVKPHRDCGVVHDSDKLVVFIDDPASDRVRVYFGIDEKFIFPDFQNVMLVDDSVVLTDIDDEEEFAFDRGSGCCPEQ